MNLAKIQYIKQWLIPRNTQEVWGFLGLTMYYRKFIKDYRQIGKPITELTKKEKKRKNRGSLGMLKFK